jgi:hypothetical protein
MAREEHDREELLRDATAYVDRAEFQVAGHASPVFVGFRRDGAASFYLSPDRVYHFNSSGELRRAFVDGLLYKAVAGELVSLERHRDPTETSLVARELSHDETSLLLDAMQRELLQLRERMSSAAVTVCGQVTSAETEARGETASSLVKDWLSQMPARFAVARSPRVG